MKGEDLWWHSCERVTNGFSIVHFYETKLYFQKKNSFVAQRQIVSDDSSFNLTIQMFGNQPVIINITTAGLRVSENHCRGRMTGSVYTQINQSVLLVSFLSQENGTLVCGKLHRSTKWEPTKILWALLHSWIGVWCTDGPPVGFLILTCTDFQESNLPISEPSKRESIKLKICCSTFGL